VLAAPADRPLRLQLRGSIAGIMLHCGEQRVGAMVRPSRLFTLFGGAKMAIIGKKFVFQLPRVDCNVHLNRPPL
jgi:hypothetical protein